MPARRNSSGLKFQKPAKPPLSQPLSRSEAPSPTNARTLRNVCGNDLENSIVSIASVFYSEHIRRYIHCELTSPPLPDELAPLRHQTFSLSRACPFDDIRFRRAFSSISFAVSSEFQCELLFVACDQIRPTVFVAITIVLEEQL